ncbi:MAG: ferrous iron transport protein A [Spirochaetes bacterium]|nr:ferrous iron transport protein A [Spirochaetota bacterium]
MNIKIREMECGSKAVITGYEKTGTAYRQKLLSMGLTTGTEIELIKVAPFGDPVEIKIRDYKLSLRKEEADVLLLKEVN